MVEESEVLACSNQESAPLFAGRWFVEDAERCFFMPEDLSRVYAQRGGSCSQNPRARRTITRIEDNREVGEVRLKMCSPLTSRLTHVHALGTRSQSVLDLAYPPV